MYTKKSWIIRAREKCCIFQVVSSLKKKRRAQRDIFCVIVWPKRNIKWLIRMILICLTRCLLFSVDFSCFFLFALRSFSALTWFTQMWECYLREEGKKTQRKNNICLDAQISVYWRAKRYGTHRCWPSERDAQNEWHRTNGIEWKSHCD